MKCTNPTSVQLYYNTPTQKHYLSWNTKSKTKKDIYKQTILLPCGKCYYCLKRHSYNTYQKLLAHYSTCTLPSYFLTLTYASEKIKYLSKRHIQLFIKRLRKKIHFDYFCLGEYGEALERPHYHLILFNCNLDDLKLWNNTTPAHYRSKTINKKWNLGIADIELIHNNNIRYIAKHKSIPNKKHFTLSSKNICKNYFLKQYKQYKDTGEIILDKKQITPFSYFINKIKRENKPLYEKHKKLKNKTILYDTPNLKQLKITAKEHELSDKEIKKNKIRNKLSI